MNEPNSIAMSQFLSYNGENFQKITLVPKEASLRNYYRVHYESAELVLCVDENFSSIPYPFLEVRDFLKNNNFPVPKVIRQDINLHAILLNDVGEKDLTSIENDDKYVLELKKSLSYILRLQELKPIPSIAEKSFHYEKLMFEIDHTCTGFERFAKTYELTTLITGEMYAFLQEAAMFLARYDQMVICHRDYHARNILLNDKGEQTIIDFQDMMMGTPQYDLSSLVYDSYRPLPLPKREELYNFFKDQSPHKGKRFREYYLTQALQRSFKALGTYIVQFHDRKNLRFKESITKSLNNLMEICQLGGFPDQLYVFVYLLNKQLNENEMFLSEN